MFTDKIKSTHVDVDKYNQWKHDRMFVKFTITSMSSCFRPVDVVDINRFLMKNIYRLKLLRLLLVVFVDVDKFDPWRQIGLVTFFRVQHCYIRPGMPGSWFAVLAKQQSALNPRFLWQNVIIRRYPRLVRLEPETLETFGRWCARATFGSVTARSCSSTRTQDPTWQQAATLSEDRSMAR